MRLAAIDIGSNSLRCSIVDAPVGGRRVTLDEEKAYVRLGSGLSQTGRLSEEAMDEALRALDRMLRIAGEYDVHHVRAVATAAVRSAANGPAFVARVQCELGLEVEVISGADEGRLALLSAIDALALTGDIGLVDIGGGSVEVVRASDREIRHVISAPLGAVVLSDEFVTEDPLPRSAYKHLSAHVRQQIAGALSHAPSGPPGVLVGSGGTVTTLGAMIAARRGAGIPGIHGFELTAGELGTLRAVLSRSSAAERSRMPGLAPARVDLILAGAVVLDEVMTALGASSLLVNARGMRAGIVVDTIEKVRAVELAADRMTSVRAFGRSCGYDANHAEHVRMLALELFDQLPQLRGLAPAARPLLEAASLLHDVGYHIAYEHHRRHSYHLISHAELPGFGPAERMQIAAIARFHAGSPPKLKHEALRDLAPAEQEAVLALASILRVADGLDRSRGRRVRHVSAQVAGDALELRVTGTPPLDIEVLGAERKADLLERVSGLRVAIAEAAG